MRRVTLLLLALMFTTSACFGTSGSWRCANGTRCEFTRGEGLHCPGTKSAALPSTRLAMRQASPACSHCRTGITHSKIVAQSPSVRPGCRCEFKITSFHVPATAAEVHSLTASGTADHPVVIPSDSMLAAGFTFRSTVFTTGPPPFVSAFQPLATPARAPPHHLSA